MIHTPSPRRDRNTAYGVVSPERDRLPSDLSAYVAKFLPSVPEPRRKDVSAAAVLASSGQGYTPESVIDAIALATLWLSPDPLSCFQNSTATVPAGIGDPVGALIPWVGSTPVTQATSGARGVLTSAGISFDGLDDILTGERPQSSTQHTLIALMKSDVATGDRIPIYVGNAASDGYGFYWAANEGLLYGGIAILENGPRTTSFGIHSATKGATSSRLFLNGIEKTLTSNTSNPLAPSNLLTFGGYIGASYHHGILGDLFVYDNDFVDRTKIERFLNSYRRLGLVL